MDIKDRLSHIIKIIGVTKKRLSEECEVSRGHFFNYLNGKQEPSSTFYKNLKKQYPWVNIEWLITGEGEPDLRKTMIQTSTPPPVDIELLKSVIAGVEEGLENIGKELDPERKAQLITLLYEHFHKSGEKTDSETVLRYLTLVA